MSKNTKKLLTTTVVASALLVGGSNGVIHADQTNDQPTDNEQKPKVLQVPKQTNKVTLKSSPQKQAQEIPATPAPKPAVAAPVAKVPAVKVTPKKVQPVVKNQEAQPKTQFTAYAADQASIMVSPYIKTTLAPNGKTGTWKMQLQLAKAMQGFSEQMKKLAKTGAYPHGRDGKNKIAYVRYTITLPKGVTLTPGSMIINNNCSFINGGGITWKQDGQKINFRIPLIDVNWLQIYDGYENDIKDPAAHAIDTDFAYEITDPAALKQSIESQGDFAFYPSGFGAMFGFGLQEFYTDKSFAPILGGPATTTSKEVKWPNKFDLGNVDLPGQGIIADHPQVTIDGKDGYIIKDHNDLTVRAILNVKKVKEQLAQIKTFTSFSDKEIALKNVKSDFTAEFKLPAGVDFVASQPVLKGSNGFYKITSYNYDPVTRILKVVMQLKDDAKIKTLADLSAAVNGMNDELVLDWKINVPAGQVNGYAYPAVTLFDTNNNAQNGKVTKTYQVTGTFQGQLQADATLVQAPVLGVVPFNFGWKSQDQLNLFTPVEITFVSADKKQGTVNNPGKVVTIADKDAVVSVAKAEPGFKFVNWTDEQGNVVSEDATLTIKADQNGNWHEGHFTAHFKKEIKPAPKPDPKPTPKPTPKPEQPKPEKTLPTTGETSNHAAFLGLMALATAGIGAAINGLKRKVK